MASDGNATDDGNASRRESTTRCAAPSLRTRTPLLSPPTSPTALYHLLVPSLHLSRAWTRCYTSFRPPLCPLTRTPPPASTREPTSSRQARVAAPCLVRHPRRQQRPSHQRRLPVGGRARSGRGAPPCPTTTDLPASSDHHHRHPAHTRFLFAQAAQKARAAERVGMTDNKQGNGRVHDPPSHLPAGLVRSGALVGPSRGRT